MSNQNVKTKKPAAKRIDDLEVITNNLSVELGQTAQNVQAIAEYINRMHSEVRSSIAVLDDCFGALVDVLGDGTREKVSDRLTEIRIAQLEEQAEADKERLAEMVENGILEAVEKVSEDSLIIGHETNPEGETLPPAWISSAFANLIPEVQEAIVGNGVGTEATLPNGNVFVVDEIYNFTESNEISSEEQ